MPSTPEETIAALVGLIVPGARVERIEARAGAVRAQIDLGAVSDPAAWLARAAAEATSELVVLRRLAWEAYFSGEGAHSAFDADPHPKHRTT